ncbi:GNAT family N-acetyltransferase [Pseudoxanthomonas mexicana]|uniref:GNAT family N-acetyltransferase n=1 Tax=Pseudoxanthomonas mexicana TaxID=128785 RepID=UPI00398BA094
MSATPALETARLRLWRFDADNADEVAFNLRLLNDPGFLHNIGDRGVRTLAQSRRHLLDGAIASYARHGFGLYRVELKQGGESVGVCGLLRRDFLDDADIGYAFLPEFRGQGHAREAAAAVLASAWPVHRLARVAAIVSPHNEASIRLLESLGMRFRRTLRLPADDHEVKLFDRDTETDP